MSEQLQQLLHNADARITASPATEDFPARIRRRRIRQRRTTRIVQAFGGAAIIAVACLLIPHLNTAGKRAVVIKSVPPSSSESASRDLGMRLNGTISKENSASALASLDLTAQLHERIANDLIASRKVRKQRATIPARDPTLAMLQQQRDRAALLLVYEADQYRKQKQPREAIAAYQKAIDLFPQSHWANVARLRLKGTI